MLDEGVVYRHPEQTEEVICWAENEAAISKVLNYHYGRKWNSLNIFGSSTLNRGMVCLP